MVVMIIVQEAIVNRCLLQDRTDYRLFAMMQTTDVTFAS